MSSTEVRRGVRRQTRATLLAALRTRDHSESHEDTKGARSHRKHTPVQRGTQMKRQAERGGRETVKRQIGCLSTLSAVTVDIDTVSQSHILRVPGSSVRSSLALWLRGCSRVRSVRWFLALGGRTFGGGAYRFTFTQNRTCVCETGCLLHATHPLGRRCVFSPSARVNARLPAF